MDAFFSHETRIKYNHKQSYNKVLGRRPFVVLREKHEIEICYQIGTVDTFKASSILIDKSRVK